MTRQTRITIPTRMKGSFVFSSTCSFLLAVVLTLTISCGSDTHAQLPTGTVDVPPLGRQAVLKGISSFAGWALGENGISDVAIYVDRRYVMSAQRNLARPDVWAAFPNEPDARTAGWQASLDCSKIISGTHELIVQATAKNGAKRDLGLFQIVVVK